MGEKIDEALKMALVQAKVWDARVKCLDMWASEAQSPTRLNRVDYDALRNLFMERALDAWRRAFMWGIVADEHKEMVKQEAANRFLKMDGLVKSSVMEHLNPWGNTPGRWHNEVEEKFRAEIRAELGLEPEPSGEEE